MTYLSTIVGFIPPGATSGSSASSGGGDPALHNGTPVSSLTLDKTGSSNQRQGYTYTSGIIPGASPSGNIKSRNVFGSWMQWYDTTSAETGFSVSSFTVNRSTGALTATQITDVWLNTAGAALSTTYCGFDPVHGCFFSGGHNAYPGYSSHVFGYTAGQLTTTGTVNGGVGQYSNTDHGQNGTFCGGLNQGTGTNYFATQGYNAATGSMAGGRVHTATSSGITVGTWADYSNFTSSAHFGQHIPQPDEAVATGEVFAAHATSLTSPNYGVRAWVDNSGTLTGTDLLDISGAGTAGWTCSLVWQGYDSKTYYQYDKYAYYLGNGTPSWNTDINDGTRDLGTHMQGNLSDHVQNIGVGNDKFLLFRPGHATLGLDTPPKCELIGFDVNHNPKKLTHFTLGSASDPSILDGSEPYSDFHVVYENDTDETPKWLICARRSNTRYIDVDCFEITADFSNYSY